MTLFRGFVKTLGVGGMTLLLGVVSVGAAFDKDLLLPNDHVRFESAQVLEGGNTRVYVSVINNGKHDLLGSVRITEVGGGQIGGDLPISVLLNRKDSVFADFKAGSPGKKKIKVEVLPWEKEGDNPANNIVYKELEVFADTDRDGVGNKDDSDDDNDGVPDAKDKFPLDRTESVDTDGDNIGNNKDPDDDNDGYPDGQDKFPLDKTEFEDSDDDGIGNNADDDDDNDGILDVNEKQNGTDPLNNDTDADGATDDLDQFPTDASEAADFDGDGIGDNVDTDDDNDGVNDSKDSNPRNRGPIVYPTHVEVNAAAGEVLLLEAPEVNDEDGEIVKLEWVNEGREVVIGRSYQTVFEEPGEYKVLLRVYDDKDEMRQAEFIVTVTKFSFAWWMLPLFLLFLLALVILIKYLIRAQKKEVN